MRGHQQSNTRKLNRHWQSGGGLKIVSFYMHCNFPYSASTEGSFNSNILLTNPGPSNIINIEVDRLGRSSGAQERLNHISDQRFERMFSLWGEFQSSISTGQSPAYQSTYYGVIDNPHIEDWNFMNIYKNEDKYKLINMYMGAFYYGPPDPNGKIRPYFTDEYTRARFFGPIYLPCPYIGGEHIAYSDQSSWEKLCRMYEKLHFWLPYPYTASPILQPSSQTTTGRVYNSDGSFGPLVTFNTFPGTFYLSPTNISNRYQAFMADYPLNVHLHLPYSWVLKPFEDIAGNPGYVREWQLLQDAGRYAWNVIPVGGDYSRKIFMQGPYYGGGIPPSSSPWATTPHRDYMPIGEVKYHFDIDINKTVEENMKDYAATI